ncbi:MAG TPA: flagellar filament capping protein FliD [Burkholderiales bacterium]|nr:flagellar filament capping protein FliD [Burkholderiales bacterium]
MATSSVTSSSSSPTLAAPGVGSGLDVNGLVSKLMAVEQQPLTALATKETGYQTKLSAYGTLKSVLSNLQSAMTGLSTPSTFQTMSATLGDSTLAAATAGSTAQSGSYSLTVQALAQSQKLISGASFANTTDTLGNGTLTIQFGTYSGGSFTPNAAKAAKTIAIPPGSNSLSGVRDAINAAGAGVTASIVNDGAGNRLVITSNDTGTANALKITAADDDGNNTDAAGLSQLAYDASTGGAANLSQTMAATDAKLLVDGITIVKSSNLVTGAIQGVTLNLTKTGGPTTLTVTRNTGAVTSAVANFVQAWNTANSAIAQMSAYDPDTNTAAVLQGDTTLLSIQSRLRNLINTPLSPANGGLSYLSDVGISFQLDGSLALDSNKLQSVLSDPGKDVASLFADDGNASDGLISFASANSSAAPGSYAVQVDQLATHGTAVGGAAANLAITAGVNDTLNFSVDGQAASITLPAGAYTAAGLAAQLQSQINGSASLVLAGSAVTVTQSGGVITLTSNLYGAGSTVLITGGNAASGLLGTPTSTAGRDAAGSIGGVAATGHGQLLTASGLTVQVAGGSTGSRGTLDFAHGFATQIGSLMDQFTGPNGSIQSRVNGINASITDIDDQRAALNQRLADIQANYQAQFTALDTLLASMQSTSSYLTQQLASLPGVASNSK